MANSDASHVPAHPTHWVRAATCPPPLVQITSGLPDTVDYFMSLDPAEPDDGVDHYSEQLVRLATHHSAFLAPVPSQVDRDSALQAFAAVQSASATAMGQVRRRA